MTVLLTSAPLRLYSPSASHDRIDSLLHIHTAPSGSIGRSTKREMRSRGSLPGKQQPPAKLYVVYGVFVCEVNGSVCDQTSGAGV